MCFLYNRKVYEVIHENEPIFFCVFLPMTSQSSLNLEIFRRKGRCNSFFVCHFHYCTIDKCMKLRIELNQLSSAVNVFGYTQKILREFDNSLPKKGAQFFSVFSLVKIFLDFSQFYCTLAVHAARPQCIQLTRWFSISWCTRK